VEEDEVCCVVVTVDGFPTSTSLVSFV